MLLLREIVGCICVVVAVALGVPLIGAVLAVLTAAIFQGDDNAE